MFNPLKEIDSRWEIEKRWLEGKYQKSSTDVTTRKLTMTILPEGRVDSQSNRPILEFQGGPTGFETYYLEDINLEGGGDFCICAGTANRWPACYVDKTVVQEFVNAYRATLKII